MRLAEAFRTATFRATVAGSLLFAGAALLLWGFVFWRTAAYERGRIDTFLHHELAALAREQPAEVVHDVDTRFAGDLHRLTFAAVFAPGGVVLGGDLGLYPPALAVDGAVHRVMVRRRSGHGVTQERARAVARRLADGRVVVVGRSDSDLARLRAVLARGVLLGLAPGVLLALLAGVLASLRMLARVAALNGAIERIMDGAMAARLPVHRRRDAVDRLAASVNRMLDRIEQLIGEVQGVGDDIAHDLRTPLSRARSLLEGGRNRAESRAALVAVVDRAIGDLDQSFATITALLRIRQIETSARRTNFAAVSLSAMVEEAADLYAPLAELRGQVLEVAAAEGVTTWGDRDLLFEALANLLDNAVKFAPQGGRVRVSVLPGPVVRVADSGKGVPEAEREAVLRRFHRADRLRQVAGTGLGLSLVAAILRLHGFRLAMAMQENLFTVDIVCGE